jgi:hypothetical protein
MPAERGIHHLDGVNICLRMCRNRISLIGDQEFCNTLPRDPRGDKVTDDLLIIWKSGEIIFS